MVHPSRPQARPDRHYRLLIGTAAFVVIAAGIKEAAEVLNSILLAMLLTVTVVPAFDALRRRGVSKGLAVILTSLLLAGVLIVLLGVLGLSGTRLIQVLPEYQERALSLRKDLEALMLSRGIHPERVFSLELVDPNRLLGLAAGFLSGLGQVLSQALLLILIVAFFLAERGIRDHTFQPGGTAARVARDVRQYLIITALTGLAFAVVVYVIMLVVGTDLPLVWSVLAFIMNYVPNVGIILSVIPPVILTLLELGWQRALVVLAGFLVLNFVVDNLIKPRFMQSGLDVPPLVGLLSLVVWAYLLGPIGALLALPLTIALRRVLQDAELAVPGLGLESPVGSPVEPSTAEPESRGSDR
jgi:predicted PurR-regulated permease PerM